MTVNSWIYLLFPLFLAGLWLWGFRLPLDKTDRELLKEKDE